MKPDYVRQGSVWASFATPILRKQIPDAAETNAALHALALEREQMTPSAGRSNVGGWHSADSDNVFEWPSPAAANLRRWVSEGVDEITRFCLAGSQEKAVKTTMSGRAWINLCRDGDYNTMHNHPNYTWSGAYYVAVGTPDPAAPPRAGRIEFLDPRMGATIVGIKGPNQELPRLSIDPQPGLLVIFPSWLYHCVNPFRGTGERISVAFNMRLRFDK